MAAPEQLSGELSDLLSRDGQNLPKGSRVMLEAYVELARSEPSGRVSARKLGEEVGRREGKPLGDTAMRARLSRLNAGLRRLQATFEFNTSGSLVAAQPTGRMDAARLEERVGEHMEQRARDDAEVDTARLVEPTASKLLTAKRLTVFFSYAHLPKELQDIQLGFFDRLKERLRHPTPQFADLPSIDLWRDFEQVRAARTGRPQMDKACEDAFLGLVMLSDKYPHSQPCLREADVFLTPKGANRRNRTCVVVSVNLAIEDIPDRFKHDARFVQIGPHPQIVRLWSKGDADDREAFVAQVANQIFLAAREAVGPPPSSPAEGIVPPSTRRRTHSKRTESAGGDSDDEVGRYMAERSYLDGGDKLVEPEAAKGRLSQALVADAKAETDASGRIEIVNELAAWAVSDDDKRARLVALLGEFGMGKTITCRLLTRRLLELRKSDPNTPLPMYFDLRDVDPAVQEGSADLEAIIDSLLRKGGDRPPSAASVIDFAQRRNALVIFDGLDELTNKMTPAAAGKLYRELLGIAPRALWIADADRRRSSEAATSGSGARAGPLLLVSCRTHYFQHVAAQRGFLTDKERSPLDADADIDTYFMLPFTNAQIEDYLGRHFGPDRAAEALALIESIYNLKELAERPILLRFIQETLGEIEREKLAGRTINIVRLYDILSRQIFERDNPKHAISPLEKRRLLQALALHLHRRGPAELAHEKLDDWVQGYVRSNHRLRDELQSSGGVGLADIFAQDVRNACFLVRPGDQDSFRFAHTSVREYFLADALYAAVLDGEAANLWNVKAPSPETLDFILKRHEIDDGPEREAFEHGLAGLLEPGLAKNVRDLAFRLWRRAYSAGTLFQRPDTMDLSGLDFSRTVFEGTTGRLYPLRNTLWIGTRLNQTEFQHVDLSGANFEAAVAPMSRWISNRMAQASFDGADLAGSIWRECDLTEPRFKGSCLDCAEAVNCGSGGDLLPAARVRSDLQEQPYPISQYWGAVLSVALGRIGDKDVVVSGGDDRTVRVFNLATGACEATLEGHQGTVLSVALGRIGDKDVVVSGGDDCTVNELADGSWSAARLLKIIPARKVMADFVRAPGGGLLLRAMSPNAWRCWRAGWVADGQLQSGPLEVFPRLADRSAN